MKTFLRLSYEGSLAERIKQGIEVAIRTTTLG